MKTKLSKKILSLFLAVLMFVTSIPVMSFTALATNFDTDPVHPSVAAADDAIKALSDKIRQKGTWVNVPAAYDAMVKVQACKDAFQYGNGSQAALDNAVANLNKAIDLVELKTVPPHLAVTTPTFPASTASDMNQWVVGTQWSSDESIISNILYASEAESIGSQGKANVTAEIFMSKDITVLYDGIDTIGIPVMVRAYKSDGNGNFVNDTTSNPQKNTRYLYAVYPSNQQDGSSDDPYFGLVGYWRSGSGDNANWNWNWWRGDNNADPAYSYDTGWAGTDNNGQGNQSDEYRTELIWNTWQTGSIIKSTHYQSKDFYHSNILQMKDTSLVEGKAGEQYKIPYWYASSGNSAGSGSDNKYITGSTINIINYTYLSEAVRLKGESMKGIELSNYSEGGAKEYMAVMEEGATFDKIINSYFATANRYLDCKKDMEDLVDRVNVANPVSNSDKTPVYAKLRALIPEKANSIEPENPGYPEAQWTEYVAAYNQALDVMTALPTTENPYEQLNDQAQAAYDRLNAAKLTLEGKVNTTALETTIDNFFLLDSSAFTPESYAAVVAKINEVKATVWKNAKYKDVLSSKDDTAEARQEVADCNKAVKDAITTLRMNLDYHIQTGYDGYMSLNEAMALETEVLAHVDEDGITKYANLAVFTDAMKAARQYAANTATDPYVNFNEMTYSYLYAIESLLTAYHELYDSFRYLENGTVCGNTYRGAITDLQCNDQGNQTIGFNYTSRATIIQTSTDPVKVKFGTGEVTFGAKMKSGSGTPLQNNGLDNIQIHAAAAPPSGSWGYSISGTTSGSNSKPGSFDGSPYSNGLAFNGFSLGNIHITDVSANNDSPNLLVLDDGTVVTNIARAKTYDLTETLRVANGSGGDPVKGAVFARTNDDAIATVTLQGDFYYDVPGADKVPLTENTKIEKDTKYISPAENPSYFAAISAYNSQNFTATARYNYYSSLENGESLDIAVTVVNAAPLMELIRECSIVLQNDEEMYTDASWTAFGTALTNAQSTFNYAAIGSAQDGYNAIQAQLQSRYDALWDAYKGDSKNPALGLKLKTFDQNFIYCDANGVEKTSTIVVTYGETLADHASELANIVPETYVKDGYTYTYQRAWTPDIDLDVVVTAPATYTAVYEASQNRADFSKYEAAQRALIDHLTDPENECKYTVADLQIVADAIADMTFYYLTFEQKDALMSDQQAAVDAETAKLTKLLSDITKKAVNFDFSAAQASRENLDADIYDVSEIYAPITSQSVDIDNVTSVEGVPQNYASQADIDQAVRDALTNKNEHVNTYTVYLNDTPVAGYVNVPYGTIATVSVDAPSAWYYSYSSPSRDNEKSVEKYIALDTQVEVMVKGNIYLRTVVADETDSTTCFVKVRSNTGNIIDVVSVAAGTEYTMPEAPVFAYYVFTGYDNGLAQGDSFTVTEDIVIRAIYEPQKEYQIDWFESYDAWMSEEPMYTENADYNELVTLSSDGAYAWVVSAYSFEDEDNMTMHHQILAYGDTYSFYACKSYIYSYDNEDGIAWSIVAITKDEYEGFIKSQTRSEIDMSNGNYNAFFNEENYADSLEMLMDGLGNPILASYDDRGRAIINDAVSVISLENVVPITNNDGVVSKFSIIGTYTIPSDAQIVEGGFLFTSETSNEAKAAMTVENVGTYGIYRYKASRHTVGNQFVLNMGNPNFDVQFTYKPYIIVNVGGELQTVYGTPVQSDNIF